MQSNSYYLLSLLLLVFCHGLFGQTHPSSSNLASENFPQIRKASQDLSKAIQSENLEAVLGLTLPETMLLPEYHLSLESPKEIESYYTQFFEQTNPVSFSKDIIEIQQIADHFLEIGTFIHTYQPISKESFSYEGKYMSWWKKDAQNQVKLVANMWGSSTWIEADKLQLFEIETPERNPILANSDLEQRVCKQVDFVREAVYRGDAQEQLRTYLDDAIYMTYYNPPFIGKKSITAYFESHYSSGGFADSLYIQPFHLIDMDEYVAAMGKYYVSWKQEGEPYFIRGKNLTLYRKMPDGSLKIYRQMVNHSQPATPLRQEAK